MGRITSFDDVKKLSDRMILREVCSHFANVRCAIVAH